VPALDITVNVGSDGSWVWSCPADFAGGGEPTEETFVLRFANAKHANMFKDAFEEAQHMMKILDEGTDIDAAVIDAEEENAGDKEKKGNNNMVASVVEKRVEVHAFVVRRPLRDREQR
jgi:RanBP1 domain